MGLSMGAFLSICIPTWNRGDFLSTTLQALYAQPRFAENCEIIVSDNGSQDNTREVVESIRDVQGSLTYLRSDTDLGASINLLKTVDAAKGEYVALLSDKAVVCPNVLDKVLTLLRNHKPSVLFMLNGRVHDLPETIYTELDFDRFVSLVSFWSTSVSQIILNKEAFNKIEQKTESLESRLIQTDWLFKIVDMGHNSMACNMQYFVDQDIGAKSGYNIFQVFITNYLGLYDRYLAKGSLKKVTYLTEKSKLLSQFIIPWYVNTVLLKRHRFSTRNAYRIIIMQYGIFAPLALLLRNICDRLFSNFAKRLRSTK
jgi:glycosyltransferase involved in cell wall biosynthesis